MPHYHELGGWACYPGEKAPLICQAQKVSFTEPPWRWMHPWVLWQPRTHPSEPRAFPAAYRTAKPPSPGALQHGPTRGSWPPTRAVQDTQEEEEVTNTGVVIPRKDTARDKSWRSWSAQIYSPKARDISFLQAMSIKLDNNTILAVPHHFQTAYQEGECQLSAQGENRPTDAATPSPLGQRSFRAYLITVPSNPCCLSSRYNAPNTEQRGSPSQ